MCLSSGIKLSQKQKMIGSSFSNSNSDISVALFIQKTYEILQNADFNHIIHWLTSGREFAIVDIALFEEEILPTYFRHRNIHSFVRQLNMYGFHKSRKDPSKNIFSNPSFIRDRTDLLPFVKRKVKFDDKLQQNETMAPSPKSSKTFAKQVLPKKVQHQQKAQKIIFIQKRQQTENNCSAPKIIIHSSHIELPQSEANLGIFQYKNMMNPSRVMDQNPAIYSNMNANEEQECMLGEEDDNISIEDEIEKERKVLKNCFSGVSLLETKNLLKSHNMLHNL